MVEQYSKMQEFRDYMDEAILVGEDIMRQLPDTYGISIVVKDIESALNPLQNKPEDNSKTLKNITEILENKFSSIPCSCLFIFLLLINYLCLPLIFKKKFYCFYYIIYFVIL